MRNYTFILFIFLVSNCFGQFESKDILLNGAVFTSKRIVNDNKTKSQMGDEEFLDYLLMGRKLDELKISVGKENFKNEARLTSIQLDACKNRGRDIEVFEKEKEFYIQQHSTVFAKDNILFLLKTYLTHSLDKLRHYNLLPFDEAKSAFFFDSTRWEVIKTGYLKDVNYKEKVAKCDSLCSLISYDSKSCTVKFESLKTFEPAFFNYVVFTVNRQTHLANALLTEGDTVKALETCHDAILACNQLELIGGSNYEGCATAYSLYSIIDDYEDQRKKRAMDLILLKEMSQVNQAIRLSKREYVRGARGGCYYVTSNGTRVYVERSFCD